MAQQAGAASIADILSGLIDNYMTGGTFTLIVYEHFITFGSEVELFWRKKITGSSILFFLNRYLVLLYQLFQVRRQWVFSDVTSCALYYNSSQAIIILCYIPWGVFSALRVFALSVRNKLLVATMVLLLSMGPAAVNLATFHWSKVVVYPESGNCTGEILLPRVLAVKLTIISRILLIAADLIVIAITWCSTYEAARTVRAGLRKGRPTTLSFLILRDGLIFFIIMVTLNLLQLIFTSTSVLVAFDHSSEITQFTEVLTAILVSRFMLNLQEVAPRLGQGGASMKSDDGSILTGGLSTSSLYFDRISGYFGASLCHAILEGDLEEDEPEGMVGLERSGQA